jgi:hypothetical protein
MRSAAVPGTDGGIAGGDAARAGSTGLIGAVQAARNAARRYDVPEAAGRSLGQYPDDGPAQAGGEGAGEDGFHPELDDPRNGAKTGSARTGVLLQPEP